MKFWDYIKGWSGNYYTFLQFPQTTYNLTEIQYKSTPRLVITKDNNISKGTNTNNDWSDLGNLLTSYDYIELAKNKNSNLEFYLSKANSSSANPTYFQFVNKIAAEISCPFKITLNDNSIDFISDMRIAGNKVILTKEGEVKATKLQATNVEATEATIDGKCQANYFNAVSDKRAKENFVYVSRAHALNWINELNIYTFNYRDNGNTSIGITTQQVQDKPINNFNFVDNIQATGENGDYMSIKESKFVYLCMSAIQELSQQNQLLQSKLEQLENKINQL